MEDEVEMYCDVCKGKTMHLKSPTGTRFTCVKCGIEEYFKKP